MHELSRPFAALNISRDVVTEFLMAFSRFEYALKRVGYAKQAGRMLNVEWRKFGKEHAARAAASVDAIRRDAKYLVDRPPRRQILDGETVRFDKQEPSPAAPGLEWLLEMAYRVRNNLFHGGKWVPIDEPARNEKLLLAALDVLRWALRLHPRAERHYFAALD
jgi:hypothetical protein